MMNDALKGTVVVAESAGAGIVVAGLIQIASAQCATARFEGTGGNDQWCLTMDAWLPYAPGIGLLAAVSVAGIASWWYFLRTGHEVHEST